ncbi:kinase-like domain-containing protein [Gloeopeniophorella convolvens]|nr:kinase-like domain-containing protein [Gloeopeniophorella convolvens]
MSSPSSFLDQYDALDVIGNGSFGIIRKVRRKHDSVILARKEIDFERMNERDRKQVVAEVNILKDLDHDHIVRYHDRYVDRDAGMLYILMEYCGGGDLSSVIKQAQKQTRFIPEETVWHYFMQILLALHYCHHPNGNSRSGGSGAEGDSKERRAPILHRDIKPDNVFLDETNSVKLGDFGLSKVLTQASLASTYVGTPYYMSPELMQEKAYDSKSDIWSLGCLVYELCAHKPPFHEAKTHSELSMAIRNGRIPPLPRGYSQALSSVIKAMLNLNPSMRPSAAQLLQHERLEFAYKVFETQKQLDNVKFHKAAILDRERELATREAAVTAQEAVHNAVVSQKDGQIATLQAQLADLTSSIAVQVHQAVVKREEELREAVLEYEKIVGERMQQREQEIMDAVSAREAEVFAAWQRHEVAVREVCEAELEGRWRVEWEKLQLLKDEIEAKARAVEEAQRKGPRREKTPLEEVKNILAPLAQLAKDPQSTPRPHLSSPTRPARRPFETPVARPAVPVFHQAVASAMKGVILTATGEPLATPAPNELTKILIDTPKACGDLGFAKIFDFDKLDEEESGEESAGERSSTPKSPSRRKSATAAQVQTQTSVPATSSTRATSAPKSPSKRVPVAGAARSVAAAAPVPTRAAPGPPTGRLRRPSVSSRTLTHPGRAKAAATSSASEADDAASCSSASSSSSGSSAATATATATVTATGVDPGRPSGVPAPAPVYDMRDEENLPSPFLRRIEREKGGVAVPARTKRPSGANLLRAAAAANNAKAAAAAGSSARSAGTAARSSVRRAGEEARKALLRT